jgi:hypothetical protein
MVSSGVVTPTATFWTGQSSIRSVRSSTSSLRP